MNRTRLLRELNHLAIDMTSRNKPIVGQKPKKSPYSYPVKREIIKCLNCGQKTEMSWQKYCEKCGTELNQERIRNSVSRKVRY